MDETEAMKEGRERHERALSLAMALATVSAIEDKFNGIGEPLPPAAPPPWRERPQWTRRSAFRGGRKCGR